jgi:hypothetical protein
MMRDPEPEPRSFEAAPKHRSRGRRRLAVAAIVAAAVVAVPGGAVAAVKVYDSMHSGIYGAADADGHSEEIANEEFLYTDSPEIVAVVKELSNEFALPPGATYDKLYARYPSNERILIQRTVLSQEVAFAAACAWYSDWLGSPARRAEDQKTIDAIPGWKYWRWAEDEGPAGASPSAEPRNDDPLSQIAAETRAGQDRLIRQFVTANC